MKSYLFSALMIASFTLSIAQAATGPKKGHLPFADIGVCTAADGRVARFLEGERLKLQQDRMDLAAKDRHCMMTKDYGSTKQYVCNLDYYDLFLNKRGDLKLQVNIGQGYEVQLVDGEGNSLSAACIPHGPNTVPAGAYRF